MSRTATASFICERALRKIGAFAITDSAAQSHEMEEARFWLDMIVGSLSGVNRCTWLVTDELTVPLSSGVGSYNFKTVLSADYPKDGLQFAVDAALGDSATGRREDIEIVSKADFERASRLDEPGRPCLVYIDRTTDPVMRVWPVPQVDNLSVKISFQKFSPDLSGKENVTGLRQAWTEWAVHKLAARIGDGPVRRVNPTETTLSLQIADDLEMKLLVYENREKVTTPPIVKPYG